MEARSSGARGVAARRMEIVVAAGFLALSAAVIVDSLRVGFGWGSDGPEAGFYPFYVALLLGAAAASILLREWRSSSDRLFAGSLELRRMFSVLLPSAAYVALLFAVGIYVSSAVFLIGFMRLQGRYGWSRALPLGVGVPLAMFLLFELGFGLPLPKGPLEGWLGY
ncbi:MAG: tripartite tricarboxylate transporter TctB family protein [Deltaproteobacteria bacterium]